MVTCLELPAVEFGKRRPFVRGIVRPYELLGRGEDFPESALTLARTLSRAFHWRDSSVPGKPQQGRSGLAFWPLDGDVGALVLRFLDDGLDDQGRPHLVRMQAGFISSTQIDPVCVATLLSPAAWPPYSCSSDLPQGSVAVSRLEFHGTEPDSAVLGEIQDFHRRLGRWPNALFVASPDYAFDFAGDVDVLIGFPGRQLERTEPAPTKPPIQLSGTEKSVHRQVSLVPSSQSSTRYGALVGIFAVGVIVGVLGHLVYGYREQVDQEHSIALDNQAHIVRIDEAIAEVNRRLSTVAAAQERSERESQRLDSKMIAMTERLNTVLLEVDRLRVQKGSDASKQSQAKANRTNPPSSRHSPQSMTTPNR